MEHNDLLGYKLRIGDHVVYATGTGSDKRMCVAEITEFLDFDRTVYRYSLETKQRWTEQVPAWKVRLQPKLYNDHRDDYDIEWEANGQIKRVPKAPKQVVIERVSNLVKVTLPDG